MRSITDIIKRRLPLRGAESEAISECTGSGYACHQPKQPLLGPQRSGYLKMLDCVGLPGRCPNPGGKCGCNEEDMGRKVVGLNPGAGKVFSHKASV